MVTVQIREEYGIYHPEIVILGEYEEMDVLETLLIAAVQLSQHMELEDGELASKMARYEANIVITH